MTKMLGFIFVSIATAGSVAHAFDYYQPLPAAPEYPADNQPTQAKVALGQQLFFDSRLSRSARTQCNQCHNVMSGGADGQRFSIGDDGRRTKRSAPALWNVAYQSVYFWDGHAASLEQAIAEHLLDPAIMAMQDEQSLMARIESIAGYAPAFQSAFGQKPSFTTVAQALATYIRTLVAPNSPFDRYIRGDSGALSEQAKQGMELFREAECLACHFGANFAGPAPGPALKMGDGFYELFPNFRGTPYEKSMRLTDDPGRFLSTGDPGHKLMWRVPSLRNIALTAPYFHNGSAATLPQAVTVMAATQRQRKLTDDEVRLLVVFLESLTGEMPDQHMPKLPQIPGKAIQ